MRYSSLVWILTRCSWLSNFMSVGEMVKTWGLRETNLEILSMNNVKHHPSPHNHPHDFHHLKCCHCVMIIVITKASYLIYRGTHSKVIGRRILKKQNRQSRAGPLKIVDKDLRKMFVLTKWYVWSLLKRDINADGQVWWTVTLAGWLRGAHLKQEICRIMSQQLI